MKKCCDNCKYKKKLIKYDYSQGGCIHTDYDGFVCMALAFEGEVVHMVGGNPNVDVCEMFTPRIDSEKNKEK